MNGENLGPGDRVRFVDVPAEWQREQYDAEPVEDTGTVNDRFTETKHTGVNSTLEQDFVEIGLDSGEEKKVNANYIGNRIEDGSGITIQPLSDPSEPVGGESVFRGTSTPTDIGRAADGEFARPETEPDIEPQPIARNNETGRFGLDPFDLSSGGVGEGLDLFDGFSNK